MAAVGQLTRTSTNHPEVLVTFGVVLCSPPKQPDLVLALTASNYGLRLPVGAFAGFEAELDLVNAIFCNIPHVLAYEARQIGDAIIMPMGQSERLVAYQPMVGRIAVDCEELAGAEFVPAKELPGRLTQHRTYRAHRELARQALLRVSPDILRRG